MRIEDDTSPSSRSREHRSRQQYPYFPRVYTGNGLFWRSYKLREVHRSTGLGSRCLYRRLTLDSAGSQAEGMFTLNCWTITQREDISHSMTTCYSFCADAKLDVVREVMVCAKMQWGRGCLNRQAKQTCEMSDSQASSPAAGPAQTVYIAFTKRKHKPP